MFRLVSFEIDSGIPHKYTVSTLSTICYLYNGTIHFLFLHIQTPVRLLTGLHHTMMDFNVSNIASTLRLIFCPCLFVYLFIFFHSCTKGEKKVSLASIIITRVYTVSLLGTCCIFACGVPKMFTYDHCAHANLSL